MLIVYLLMKSSVQDEKFSKIKSKCCALKKNIFAIMDYQHNELIQGTFRLHQGSCHINLIFHARKNPVYVTQYILLMARGFILLLIRASVVFMKGFILFAYPCVRSIYEGVYSVCLSVRP